MRFVLSIKSNGVRTKGVQMEWKKFQSCLICILSSFGRAVHPVYGPGPSDCPLPEGIYPCFCNDDDGDSWVQCNHISTEAELRSGLSGLKGFKVWKLSLFVNRLGTINSSLFADLVVDRLELENTTVTLEPPQMKGLESSLSSLHLRSCYDEDHPISGWSLSHLTHLRELTVDNNVIPTLRNDWITSSPRSLRSVTVENNAIEEMEDEVFSGMTWLTFLYLETNQLTALRRSMFPRPAEHLKSINLSNNKISYLPYDIFEDMPNLRGIDMENNRLTTVDEAVWNSVIKQLTRLNVEENPLVCDRKMKWLLSHRVSLITIDGRCHNPENLRNKPLRDLAAEDLQ